MKVNFKDFLYKYRSVIGLVIFSIIISILNDRFFTMSNVLNILRQTSINSIIAAGMTFVILTGGIDLSIGSTLALTGAISAYLISSGVHPLIAVLVALVAGLIIGMINGLIISKGKVQPFIVTLATMTILRGATMVFTNGRPISTGYDAYGEFFNRIGAGYIFGVPNPVIVMIIVFVISYIILKNTTIGRYVFAVGGNEDATKLSGINVDKVKVFVYGINGLLAALAGIIITSRLSSAQPTAGSGYELDAIAAVVLGGTSLAGGFGSILGTIVGALIIGILNNALNLMDVTSYYQLLLKGLVILLAVLLDRKQK
jgi:ribose transport system permease protein